MKPNFKIQKTVHGDNFLRVGDDATGYIPRGSKMTNKLALAILNIKREAFAQGRIFERNSIKNTIIEKLGL